jgi:hypothetical protein
MREAIQAAPLGLFPLHRCSRANGERTGKTCQQHCFRMVRHRVHIERHGDSPIGLKYLVVGEGAAPSRHADLAFTGVYKTPLRGLALPWLLFRDALG